jgi:FAD/FMN-containing dehydrogenase
MTTTSEAHLSLLRLRDGVEAEVVAPGDAGYDAARKVFLPQIDRRPAAIVWPRDPYAVSRVIEIARESALEFAVRGGGHSSAGHGVTDGGIVLDLTRLKALKIDPERRVTWAQTGLTAGEFTAAAAEHGLGVSFGDTGSVDIGGLTLGGGIGYLVRKHGLTIDSLLGAEIVTADGRMLQVDADTHPDLFWAIRGGGGNFGAATRFTYRLQPVASVTGGMLVLPATAASIASFVEAAAAAPDEVSTIANVMPAPPLPFPSRRPPRRARRLGDGASCGPAGRRRACARAVPHDRGTDRRHGAADVVSRDLPSGRRPPTARGGTNDVPRDGGRNRRCADSRTAAVVKCPDALAQLRVLGGAMAAVPVDATAFAHRTSPIMATVAAVYAKPDEAPVHEVWATRAAKDLRQGDVGAYVNFLEDEGEERVRAAYPGLTWDRLASVKRDYDPDNLFRLNQNIPPAP